MPGGTQEEPRTQDLWTLPRLFVNLRPPHKQASLNSMRTWLVRTLKETGTAYPTGSTRAASASFALANRISIGSMLAFRDWTRAQTLFTYYIQRVPASVLQAIAQNSSSTTQGEETEPGQATGVNLRTSPHQRPQLMPRVEHESCPPLGAPRSSHL